jgi:hypothetical protein
MRGQSKRLTVAVLLASVDVVRGRTLMRLDLTYVPTSRSPAIPRASVPLDRELFVAFVWRQAARQPDPGWAFDTAPIPAEHKRDTDV